MVYKGFKGDLGQTWRSPERSWTLMMADANRLCSGSPTLQKFKVSSSIITGHHCSLSVSRSKLLGRCTAKVPSSLNVVPCKLAVTPWEHKRYRFFICRAVNKQLHMVLQDQTWWNCCELWVVTITTSGILKMTCSCRSLVTNHHHQVSRLSEW